MSSSTALHFTFWDRFFDWTWSLLFWPDWQSGKYQGSAYCGLPRTGIIGTYQHGQIFKWTLGIQTQVLCGKDFAIPMDLIVSASAYLPSQGLLIWLVGIKARPNGKSHQDWAWDKFIASNQTSYSLIRHIWQFPGRIQLQLPGYNDICKLQGTQN